MLTGEIRPGFSGALSRDSMSVTLRCSGQGRSTYRGLVGDPVRIFSPKFRPSLGLFHVRLRGPFVELTDRLRFPFFSRRAGSHVTSP